MIFLFISECEKKAFARTRTILDRYARQVGRRTWSARLSQQALDHIHRELRQSATRQTAIICHRIHGKRGLVKSWHVGNRRNFDLEGNFAFSTTGLDVIRAEQDPAPMQRALAYGLTIAAWFHDLGKYCSYFQQQLRGKDVKGSPIRHELLSYRIFRAMVRLSDDQTKKQGAKPSDASWLTDFAENTQQLMADTIKGHCLPGGDFSDHQEARLSGFMNKEMRRRPLLFTVGWLILSHHRLPKSSLDSQNLAFFNSAYINPKAKTNQNAPGQVDSKVRGLWAEEKSLFAVSVQKVSARLLRLLETETGLFEKHLNAWLYGTVFFGRSALMLADHLAASQGTEQPFQGPDPDSIAFANTKDGRLCDTLPEHLRKVGRSSPQMLHHLLGLKRIMPTVPKKHVPFPKGLESYMPDRFHWQNRAASLIHKQKGKDHFGFFGVLIASTGSGKTRAQVKLLSAFDEGLRFTLALGLRTLTLQSGKAYREKMGFRKEWVETLIGSETAQILFEQQTQDEDKPAKGDENLLIDNLDPVSLAHEIFASFDEHLPQAVRHLFERASKGESMVGSPILITTVDHLVPSLTTTRARHLVSLLRLATSDLVLDEVDTYSESDILVLLKLAFLTGLFGRKLIISSATLSTSLATAFYRMYQYGLDSHKGFHGFPARPCLVGWFSDYEASQKVTVVDEDAQFRKYHEEIVRGIGKALDERPRKHGGVLVELGSTKEAVFEAVLDQCRTFHKVHRVRDPESGRLVSIGLVRWARVVHCRDFARFLAERGFGDVPVRVVCYHARFHPYAQHVIESRLDRLLRRNDPRSFWSNPLIEKALGDEEEVCIVVSATPIEEVGRDHDFDWAVVEPTSLAAFIQLIGRVLRHRDASAFGGEPNVGLLASTMRFVEGKRSQVFSRPGPEGDGYALEPGTCESDLAFLWSRLCACLHAGSLLADPDDSASPMRLLSHRRLMRVIEGDRDRMPRAQAATAFAQEPILACGSFHYEANRFRSGPPRVLITRFEDGSWGTSKGMGSNMEFEGKRVSEDESLDEKVRARFLIEERELEEGLTVANRLFRHQKDVQRVCNLFGMTISTYLAAKSLSYHPLLGLGEAE